MIFVYISVNSRSMSSVLVFPILRIVRTCPNLTAADLMAASQTPSLRRGAPSSLADVQAALDADQRLEAARRKSLQRCRPYRLCRARPTGRGAARHHDRDRSPAAGSARARARALEKTIANTRSRLKAALLHLSDAPALPPHGTPLSADWARLYGELAELRLRHGLSRIIRVASFRANRAGEASTTLSCSTSFSRSKR